MNNTPNDNEIEDTHVCPQNEKGEECEHKDAEYIGTCPKCYLITPEVKE